MHARVVQLKGDPNRIDEAISMINDRVIPTIKGMDGFVSGYWMADRATGEAVGVVLWESQEALEGSDEAARQMREGVAKDLGATIDIVGNYEVIAQA